MTSSLDTTGLVLVAIGLFVLLLLLHTRRRSAQPPIAVTDLTASVAANEIGELRAAIAALSKRIDGLVTESSARAPAPAGQAAPELIGTAIELPGAGGFTVPIVGESYRQNALKALSGERRMRGENVFFTAALVAEPGNAYDPNAIKIFIHGGAHVGYLAKEVALEYRDVAQALTAANAAGLCRATLIGGQKGKPSIGVVLDLGSPSEVLAAITPPQVF